MGQTITGNVVTNFAFTEQVTVGVLAPQNLPVPIAQTTKYTTAGTATGECDTIFGKPLTFVASTPQTFDMQSMTDPVGNSIVFARVREFVVQNTSTTAGYNLTLYSTSSDGWPFIPPVANEITIPPGGMFVLRDPISSGSGVGLVVTSTTYGFTLNPGSNAITANILIAGGSAA